MNMTLQVCIFLVGCGLNFNAQPLKYFPTTPVFFVTFCSWLTKFHNLCSFCNFSSFRNFRCFFGSLPYLIYIFSTLFVHGFGKFRYSSLFLACNHVTRRPCLWCVGGQYNRIFSRNIYMKIGFSSRGEKCFCS